MKQRISVARAATFVAALGLLVATAGPLAVAKGPTVRTQAPTGTVVDGLYEEPNLLNPLEGPTETYGDIVMTSMFANLLETLPSGKMAPMVAKQVPTVANGGISKNGLDYTFHLKHTEWNDGTPFTANDVEVSWEVIMSKGFIPASTVGFDHIKSFKIMDPYDFQIILKAPFPELLEDCYATDYPGVAPAEVFQKLRGKAAADAAYAHDPTVSNGPFELKQWVSGQSITVVPNPHWFGPKVASAEINFEVVPNQNTLLADIQAHSINAYYFVPIQQLKPLQKTKGVTVVTYTQPAWESATVNFRNPEFDMPTDPKTPDATTVQALQMAINENVLVKDVWDGKATTIAADQPSDSSAYNPKLKVLPYNPKKALSMLESQGFKMGADGYLSRDGKEFDVVYSTTADNDWRAEDERLLQAWFKVVGVKMTIKDYPADAYFGTVLPSGKNWDMGEFEFEEGIDPQSAMQSIWGTGQSENFGAYSNASLDTLFTAAAGQVGATRNATLRKAESILQSDPPNVWMYSPEEIDATYGMTGYVPNNWMEDTWNVWGWAAKG